ncbi:MAG: transcription repressor NadR [Atopobiaceae bacterium]|jgi:transcriptional regulator of NAD metabolism|nr:transcription repressor NadR [Atopobiaceae bacterium]MCH4180850.1 transcription repressor NadR [Atopobiaceae bacterium]MCH4213477.1 transcription repressor NadR [Atopobiaceae bacterium]MCH4230423.1 transcription repressor NadR [Atopobiaceae bacterium]MCH4277146.1 transcription repressor NadR [Atopobiaceae bacterium]
MSVSERRDAIVQILTTSALPVPAKDLAARFEVSRQVIVKDMAVIRASVPGILSTNLGYVMQDPIRCAREFKVCHTTERAAEELGLIVGLGGRVRNVSISHRVYGRITAELDISSEADVRDFVSALGDSKSTLLSNATSGYHYHLVEASTTERLDAIEQALDKAGLLAPPSAWERMGASA